MVKVVINQEKISLKRRFKNWLKPYYLNLRYFLRKNIPLWFKLKFSDLNRLSKPMPVDLAKKMFKKYVTLVEIEAFSYCNRKCHFCPNSFIDRKSTNNYMPEEHYLKIIKELAEVDYDKRITYSRYNEPFSDDLIFTRVKQARELLPKAYLMTFTNGDYINKTRINKAIEVGFNEINIMIYFPKGKAYSNEYAQKRIDMMAKKLGLGYDVLNKTANSFDVQFKTDELTLYMHAANFDDLGSDRGGLLKGMKKYVRTAPCYMTINHMYIDYNGSYMPCCNLRSDVDEHKNYVIGDSFKKSIFEVYGGRASAMWKKGLLFHGLKSKPCDTCNMATSLPIKDWKDGNLL